MDRAGSNDGNGNGDSNGNGNGSDDTRLPSSIATIPAPDASSVPTNNLDNSSAAGAAEELSSSAALQSYLEPLSHSQFLSPSYDTSSFLLTRQHIPLDDLRSELRIYLTSLKTQLIEIINTDYEDFINLGGSHLLGSDEIMSLKMRKPLEQISKELKEAKEELMVLDSRLEDRLRKREIVRERKAKCRRLLGTLEQARKVEEMLLIKDVTSGHQQQPPQLQHLETEQGSAEAVKSPNLAQRRASAQRHNNSKVDRSMGSDTKRVERIAQEYNQLLYLVKKSRGLQFVESLQPRIERITSVLLQDLSSLLFSTINLQRAPIPPSLISSSSSRSAGGLNEVLRARQDQLSDIFKTYASINKYREAEEVVRRYLVQDFVTRTIHREALLAPQSPLMPMTPFNGGTSGGGIGNSLTAALLSPAPVSASSRSTSPGANAGSSFPFHSIPPTTPSSVTADEKLSIPNFYILEPIPPPTPGRTNTDIGISDALVELYNKILVFIQKDMSVILEVTERKAALLQASREKTNSGIGTGTGTADSTAPGSPLLRSSILPGQSHQQEQQHPYDILTSILFTSIFHRLFSELSHFIFTSGRPDSFHRNYIATGIFIERIESLCPNIRFLNNLRNSESYRELERRWQTPLMVYFQLRWKEIVQGLEATLNVGTLTSAPTALQSSSLLMLSSEAVYKAITLCWSDEIYLFELSGRFWKLSLQLVSRYRTWLESKLSAGSTGSSTGSALPTAAPQEEMRPKPLQSSASGYNLRGLLHNPLSGSQPSSRSNTPGPTPSHSASSSTVTSNNNNTSEEASDETTLRQVSIVIADTVNFEKMVLHFFDATIERKLPKSVVTAPHGVNAASGTVALLNAQAEGRLDDEEEERPRAILTASLSQLTSINPSLVTQLTSILCKRCSEPLRLVRSGASQVRAKSTKSSNVSVEPSYFVPNILRPLHAYFDSSGNYLDGSSRLKIAREVFEDLATKYEAALSKMKRDTDALRRMKKGRVGGGGGFSSLFGGGGSSSGNTGGARAGEEANAQASEDEKIKVQMHTDIEAFAEDAKGMGVDVEASSALRTLRAVVEDWTK